MTGFLGRRALLLGALGVTAALAGSMPVALMLGAGACVVCVLRELA
jgi:hypothetical protein